LAPRVRAPRGTLDVLPEEGRRRRRLARACEDAFERAGYGPMETPAFEDTELFARGVGESTDIVQKEMFTFTDQGGRSLTLRPEGTAGICRAYAEHGLHKRPLPFRCWYLGPFFRHERPQTGRYRQFTQVGAEALGSDDPSLDAELILLLRDVLEGAGVPGTRLRLGSLGTPDTRRAYSEELRSFLRAREDELAPEVRARLDQNPLRAFDSEDPGTRRVTAGAPRLLDRLSADDAQHFDAVRALLDDAGVGYDVDGTLVRGLDYYTRTVFEFTSDALGAQSAVGGGGRYDGLVEQLGGPPTPGVGWAAGIERILLAAGRPQEGPEGPVFVALGDPRGARRAFGLVRELRAGGVRAEMEQAGRSLKGQLRHAARVGAPFVIIVDEDGGMRVRDMARRDERAVGDAAEAIRMVAGILDGTPA
jgi:histidyl-tRNA synthetase